MAEPHHLLVALFASGAVVDALGVGFEVAWDEDLVEDFAHGHVVFVSGHWAL